jgi:hypothetical protein
MSGRWFKWESYIVGILISIPLWANVLIPDKEPVKESWLPRIDTRDFGPSNAKKMVKPFGPEYDWENDYRNQTHEWFEFLEDIENRGLDPWDPEAIEMWDKNYN